MGFIKRMLRKHKYAFLRNIYGDEIYEFGGNRSLWVCEKCRKVKSRAAIAASTKGGEA